MSHVTAAEWWILSAPLITTAILYTEDIQC